MTPLTVECGESGEYQEVTMTTTQRISVFHQTIIHQVNTAAQENISPSHKRKYLIISENYLRSENNS